MNGDGLSDVIVGAQYNNSDGSFDNGAGYVVFGKANGNTVDLDNVALGAGGFKILGEESSDFAGYSVSDAGDVNGDGLSDLLVGAFWNNNDGTFDNGAAYVVFGKPGGSTVDLDAIAAGNGFKILGESLSDLAAISVSAAGDVNGDGLADLIVGAPNNDSDGSTDNGAAYVVFGKMTGGAVDLDNVALGIGGFKILGESTSDFAGNSVSAAGDVNADGFADLIVGAPRNDSDGSNDNGAAYVVFGKPNGGTVDLDQVASGVGGFKILGEKTAGDAGTSVSAAGDVNGDGIADLFVGAPYDSSDGSANNGAGYVVFGKAGLGTVDLDNVAVGVGGFKILGELDSDLAGYSVSSAGDVNGDGLTDLLIGAYRSAGPGQPMQGAAYLVLGKKDGATVDLDTVAAGTGGFKIYGERAYDTAGFSVSAAGDVNDDGLADLLVGAYGNDSDGSGENGAAYVIFGNANWLI